MSAADISAFDRLPPIPYAIRLFERVQITAVAMGWINATFIYHEVLRGKISPFIFTTALVTASAVVAVLVFQISRRRSSHAKWLLIVLSALATAPWFAVLRHAGIDYHGALALLSGGLQIAALFLLVHPSARAWFASRRD
jgi:hypothetical protein